jgi:hypothetical protein
VGDFNGDGRADLAYANFLGSDVSVLIGNGDGTFQAAFGVPVGIPPQSVCVGDFNGDGRPDLAVALAGNTVSILLGNGDGTFQPAAGYAVGGNPVSVVAGDFNADGKADLASANYADNNISVLLGRGDGTFQPAVNSPAGSFPIGLAPYSFALVGADFDGDGKTDLAVANVLLLGKGDGTFRPASTLPGPGCQMMAAADFNGDGKADLVCNNVPPHFRFLLPGELSVLLGNGDGTFQVVYSAAAGNFQIGTAVGDFNGDGKLDIAYEDGILLGDGTGRFAIFQSWSSLGVPNIGGPLMIGDFNGDGRVDLASPGFVFLGSSGLPIASATATAGTPQATAPGTAFPIPLQVSVQDILGNPVSGVPVTFGVLLGQTGAGATLSSPTAFTNAAGVASVTATADSVLGNYYVQGSAGGRVALFVLANTTDPAATVGVQTQPAGLTIVVDGGAYTSPQTFRFAPGSTHTIAAPSAQFVGGVPYYFQLWSDAGTISHSITASSQQTWYLAYFATQSQPSVAVQTSPAGLPIIVDGITYTAPQSFGFPPGSSHTIAAGSPLHAGANTYVFSSWSDGGDASHSITASSSLVTYTAFFSLIETPSPTSSVVLSVDITSAWVGQALTLTAGVLTSNATSPAGGSVRFSDGTKVLGTIPVVANTAALTTTFSTVGSHLVTAQYTGDAVYPPSSVTYGLYVTRRPDSLTLTSTASSAASGQPVGFTAKLVATGPGVATPSGQVQFFTACACGLFGSLENRVLIGEAPLVNGAASITVTALPVGSTQVVAMYFGDDNWSGTVSNLITQTISAP